MTVAAILKRKAFRAAVVAPADHVQEVARILANERAEAALVLDPAQQLLGIVSERDIVEALAVNGARMLDMTAGQLMIRPRHSVSPRTSLGAAMRTMLAGPLHDLPVIDDEGQLVGIIGLADVARATIAREEGALAA